MTEFAELLVSGITNSFLSEQSAQTSQRSVQWDAFAKANMITNEELAAINRFVPFKFEANRAVLQDYFGLLIVFLQKIARVDAIQSILVLLDQCVIASASSQELIDRIAHQHNNATTFDTLLRMLKKDDQFVQLKAAKVIAELVSLWKRLPDDSQIVEYLNWNLTQLAGGKSSVATDVSLQCLMTCLRLPFMRKLFWERTAGVELLVGMLKTHQEPQHVQIQYQLVTCLWQLSLSYAVDLQGRYDIIPLLVDIMQGATKEKVLRVSAATINNMVTTALKYANLRATGDSMEEADVLSTEKVASSPSAAIIQVLVGVKAPQLVENLLSRKLLDEDLVQDCKQLSEKFKGIITSLTTWDEYVSELRSKRLEWSPVHTSEQLWKSHASKLLDNKCELLKILIEVLDTAKTPVQLAVACNDIGALLKHTGATGKKAVQELGAKTKIMTLMQDRDSEVRYQALVATQQYMSNAWEFQANQIYVAV